MRLTQLPERYAVARAATASPVPAHLFAGAGFVSITRTEDEMSVVAREDALAGFDPVETGWVAFKVAGPLEFSMTGVLSDLSGALARDAISLFAISTYDTDYILVKSDDAARATDAWTAEGHQVSS